MGNCEKYFHKTFRHFFREMSTQSLAHEASLEATKNHRCRLSEPSSFLYEKKWMGTTEVVIELLDTSKPIQEERLR